MTPTDPNPMGALSLTGGKKLRPVSAYRSLVAQAVTTESMQRTKEVDGTQTKRDLSRAVFGKSQVPQKTKIQFATVLSRISRGWRLGASSVSDTFTVSIMPWSPVSKGYKRGYPLEVADVC